MAILNTSFNLQNLHTFSMGGWLPPPMPCDFGGLQWRSQGLAGGRLTHPEGQNEEENK